MNILRILKNPKAVYHYNGSRIVRTLNGRFTHHFKMSEAGGLMMSDCKSAGVTEWLCNGSDSHVWKILCQKANILP